MDTETPDRRGISDKEGVRWLNRAINNGYWQGHREGYDLAASRRLHWLVLQTIGFIAGFMLGGLVMGTLGVGMALSMLGAGQ